MCFHSWITSINSCLMLLNFYWWHNVKVKNSAGNLILANVMYYYEKKLKWNSPNLPNSRNFKPLKIFLYRECVVSLKIYYSTIGFLFSDQYYKRLLFLYRELFFLFRENVTRYVYFYSEERLHGLVKKFLQMIQKIPHYIEADQRLLDDLKDEMRDGINSEVRLECKVLLTEVKDILMRLDHFYLLHMHVSIKLYLRTFYVGISLLW